MIAGSIEVFYGTSTRRIALALGGLKKSSWPEQTLALTKDVISADVPAGLDAEQKKTVNLYVDLKVCFQGLPTVLGLFDSAEARRVQQQIVDNLKATASPSLPSDGFAGVIESLKTAATTLKRLVRSDDNASVDSTIQEISRLVASLSADEDSELVAVVDEVAVDWAGKVANLQREVRALCKCDPGNSFVDFGNERRMYTD